MPRPIAKAPPIAFEPLDQRHRSRAPRRRAPRARPGRTTSTWRASRAGCVERVARQDPLALGQRFLAAQGLAAADRDAPEPAVDRIRARRAAAPAGRGTRDTPPAPRRGCGSSRTGATISRFGRQRAQRDLEADLVVARGGASRARPRSTPIRAPAAPLPAPGARARRRRTADRGGRAGRCRR